MKLRALAVGILISFVSLAISLTIFELVLRTIDPNRGLPINGRSEQGWYTWGHPVSQNAIGFREREFSKEKPKDTFRIMVVGDSLTWGAGLSREQRYTNQLEGLLNDALGGSPKVEVLNFGVSGGPFALYLQLVERYIKAIDADLLIVGYCFNDMQPKSQDYSQELYELRDSLSAYYTLLDGYAALAPSTSWYLRQGIERSFERFGLVPTWWEALDRTYQPKSDEWRFYLGALEKMVHYSKLLNLPKPVFLVLNQSASNTEATNYSEPTGLLTYMKRWYELAEKAAEDAGFAAMNVEQEYIEQLSDAVPVINRVDGHPSAELNRIYAEKLFSYLIVNDVIATSPAK